MTGSSARITRCLYGLIVAALLASMTGCSGGGTAVAQSVRQLFVRGGEPDVRFDPKFAYLRITRGSRTAFLWRGSTEQAPDGPIEVYYSGSGEVLRLQNGRIVGALGLTTEWRRVSLEQRSWASLAGEAQPAQLTRVRDVMPGYRTGIRERLVVRAIAPPSRSALRGIEPQTLTWFEERAEPASGGAAFWRAATGPGDALPPARYAVELTGGTENVIYSEQCLAPDLCFTWQRWSGAMQSEQAARTR